jgi:hypothetical protein
MKTHIYSLILALPAKYTYMYDSKKYFEKLCVK